jgi:UDP-glucuronate decarboxylase
MARDKNKKILVTGGAGFIGSHLCDVLLGFGHQVICLDNFESGSEQNIRACLKNPNFRLLDQDVVHPIDIDIDEIYNLACPASPKNYQKDPIKTTKTIVLGALNMLELAANKSAKLFQASTSEVYGDPSVSPQHELYHGNVNPVGIRSCYDEGKRCAESLCFDFMRKYHLDVKVGRIFNTYGPRMQKDDGRVVPNFINQALQDIDITVYGSGYQTRSLCYVADLVNAIIRFMKSEIISQPVNLGNPREMTIIELAKMIVSLTESSSRIRYEPLPEDDPQKRCPDIGIAMSLLDWRPEVSVETGIMHTINFYREANTRVLDLL